MASLNFRITGKKELASINARMNHEGTEVEVKTGFKTLRKDWDNNKKRVKPTKTSSASYNATNKGLREFEEFFHIEINKAQSEKMQVSKIWLKNLIPRCFHQPSKGTEDDLNYYFIPFVKHYIELAKTKIQKKTGKVISPRTIQDYQGTVKKLEHFEDVIWMKKIRHLDITVDFRDKFVKYCSDFHANNPKSIGGEIDNIKLFCRRAELADIKINKGYKDGDFHSPNNPTHDIALTEAEMISIYEVDLSCSERLDNARDWFVFGLWTGLRVGDLLKLTHDDIEDDEFFVLKNRKTDILVVIPVHAYIKSIFKKRNGAFPRRISPQKFNDYIKEVAELAGITEMTEGARKVKKMVKGYKDSPVKAFRKEVGKYPKYQLVSSHTCRRSFATFHHGKLDTLTIMNITGHKTEKQFLEYVKIKPRTHAQALKNLWNEHYKKTQSHDNL